MCFNYIWKYLFFMNCFKLIIEAFNPFMDSDLHTIDWGGPTSTDVIGDNVIVMKTTSNEKYKCILPFSKDSEEERKKSYNGPTPDELMQSLFEQKSCSYRIESYWTYELCHGKYIRQYHENKELNAQKKPKIQEYFLGIAGKAKKGSEDQTEDDEELNLQTTEIKLKKIDTIELPYYEVNMTNGTTCDLTNAPRQARVLYVCQPDGRGEIYEFKESSTCEYEIVVLTSVLCPNPLFKPKNPPVSKITCHSLDGSPVKPTVLDRWNREDKKHMPSEPVIIEDSRETPEEEIITDKGEGVTVKVRSSINKNVDDTTLGDVTDREVLRGFLSGSQCIFGGSGWWKHELCFNKKVKQYHEDQNGKTEIILGTWNEQKHLDWVTKTPSKKPKPKGQRSSVGLLYTDGDLCDLTGTKRFVEVKLKCVKNPEQPHSISLYLIEPKPCEYFLGIESPLFCAILDRADDDGIIRDLNV